MKACPCGSGLGYEECCRPLIAGERKAQTAEQVMRSRYSAYVEKEIPYLRSSLHPDHRGDFDEKSSRAWAEGSEWHSLEIVKTVGGGPDDDEGEVEFIASFSQKGVRADHRELATFARSGGEWFFVDGKEVKAQPVVRAAPKVGRNDPCPCGSGKKHKKCCGA
jgi:SEC-C motif-containing protein